MLACIEPRNMKLILEPIDGDQSSFNESCSSEPCSPDSGFSSDDSTISDTVFAPRFTRAKTLPSALRRSRSKQSVKRVRFADTLGLDLEYLKYFATHDDTNQLINRQKHHSFQSTSTQQSPSFYNYVPPPIVESFGANQPRLALHNFNYRSEHEYNEITRASRVCVAALRAAGSSIVGQVNLLNISFDKAVRVRYTTDGWATQDEIVANYSHRMFATHDIDAFNFTIVLPVKFTEGKCEFCVQYIVGGEEYWDNNDGSNYIVNVSMSANSPSSSLLPRIGSLSISSPKDRRSSGQLPSIPCNRRRQSQRRWGKSIDADSDDEPSPYMPSRRCYTLQ